MAKLAAKPSLQISITLTINEEEAKALDALAGYGTDNFLKVFYEKMGRYYLEPHEKGLRTLFDCVRYELPSVIKQVTLTQDAFDNSLKGKK